MSRPFIAQVHSGRYLDPTQPVRLKTDERGLHHPGGPSTVAKLVGQGALVF